MHCAGFGFDRVDKSICELPEDFLQTRYRYLSPAPRPDHNAKRIKEQQIPENYHINPLRYLEQCIYIYILAGTTRASEAELKFSNPSMTDWADTAEGQRAIAAALQAAAVTAGGGQQRPGSPTDMSVDSVPDSAGADAVDTKKASVAVSASGGNSNGPAAQPDDDDNSVGNSDASSYDASATFDDDDGMVENDDEYSYEYVPSDEEGKPRRRFGEDSDSDSDDDDDNDGMDGGNGGYGTKGGGAKKDGGKKDDGSEEEEEKKADDVSTAVVPVPSLVGAGAGLQRQPSSSDDEDVSPRDAKRPTLEHPNQNRQTRSSAPVSPGRARRIQQRGKVARRLRSRLYGGDPTEEEDPEVLAVEMQQHFNDAAASAEGHFRDPPAAGSAAAPRRGSRPPRGPRAP